MIAATIVAMAFTLAADKTKPTAEWRPLFDGKSVEGWEHVGPGKFVLDDGALRTEGGMGLLWFTGEKFGDCTIRVVYKVEGEKSNGGVFVRIADKPKDPWYAVHHGFEVQVLGGPGPDAFHTTGAIYSLSPAKARPSRPVGEWNTMEIALKGEHVIISVNGTEVNDFDATGPVPERKKDYEPERGPRPTSGYIGLQNHDGANGTRVYYKEVSVKPL